MDTYTADSIKILKPEEATERFEWLKIQELAKQYCCTPQWIERGFEACWRAGESKDYFIERYLKKNREIAVNPHVSMAFRDLLQEQAEKMI